MKHKMQRLSLIGLALALAFGGVYLLLMPMIPSSQNLTALAHPLAEINACGTIITNTTWTSDNLYVANGCDVVVGTGVTLTIQAGTAVKFGGAASAFVVQGRLDVAGTQASPVAITSLNDDAHGSAAAGSSGTPAAGDWYGIHFAAGSDGNIEHAFIGYAGSGVFNWTVWGLIGNGYGVAQVRVMNASLNMQHTTVDSGLRSGIYLEGSGVTPTLQQVHVSNNTGDTSPPYSNAVYQTTVNMQTTYSDLTFSGNDVDAVVIDWDFGSPMTQDATLGGTVFSFNCGYTGCPLTIPDGMTLTVAPGTQLSFPAFAYRLVTASGGTLLAEGTPTQPITFTSILTTPLLGDWQGIVVDSGGTARLAHCDVSYGGRDNYGGIDLSATDVQISDCHIHHHLKDGVYMRYQDIAPTFTDVDVTDNGRYGIYFYGSNTRLTFEGGSIQRNTQDGVSMYGSGNSPTFRNVAVNNNGGDGMHFNAHGTKAMLEDVDFNGNSGAAVRWWAGTSPTFRNLSASGNGMDALINVGGDVWGGNYWAVADAGLPLYMVGDTKIRSGAVLSIEPGTTLIMTPTVNITDWWAEGNAALYALGTAEKPITFTGMTETPGAWGYIDFSAGNSRLFLNNCTVEYGGVSTSYGMINLGGSGTKIILNSRIHHSNGAAGIKSTVPVLMRNNAIFSNANYGVLKNYGPSLDALSNWWGDASGPYNSTHNPTGTGNAVNDDVDFDPWLTTPPTGTVPLGQMIVDTGAPERVSPGQTVEYAIHYINGMTETVESAVLLMQLPHAAEYVDSSHGGTYWPERDQVFWKLGDVAPDDRGLVSVRVRFYWGLPSDYTDGTITFFAGSNYNVDVIDVEKYNNYTRSVIASSVGLSQAQFDALRAAHPDLETLYQQALTQGYEYVKASRATYDDSEEVTSLVMVTSDNVFVRVLSLKDSYSLATTMGGNLWVLQDTSGGMTLTVQTMQTEYWGNWIPDDAASSVSAPIACSEKMCNTHCVGKRVTFKVVTEMAKSALSFFTFGVSSMFDPPSNHVKDVVKIVTDCYDECEISPLMGCCDTQGQVRWLQGTFSGWCSKGECNETTGTYNHGELFCAFGTKCKSGVGDNGGCKPCQSDGGTFREIKVVSPQVSSSACASSDAGEGDCDDLGLLVGKDPNAKYGPLGDLLPGELVTYTITYENVGAGRVYGVYLTDELSDVFDDDTLQIEGGGVYMPSDRNLVWMVGELGPKGDPDSEGVVTFTVRLRDDLSSGTVVSNQAIVFFPSVPEETPTNPVVSQIQPLAAVPQDVATNYRQAVAITLEGRSVGALPLTFTLDEPPLVGSLTGTLPNLVYTPPENFTGVVVFSFIVSNGTMESRPAYVRIVVSSVGDSTPPQVSWSNPADGASNVTWFEDPIYTDTLGPVYRPVIAIGFSEALSATTVTTETVLLESAAGAVPASVTFDGLFNQVLMSPRAQLLSDTVYTGTLMSGIADLANNLLGLDYRWHFTIATAPSGDIYLPLIMRQH